MGLQLRTVSCKHLFKDCVEVQVFWELGPLKLKPALHGASSVFCWVENMVELLHGGQLGVFFMSLWLIWLERNKVVWNDGSFNLMAMIDNLNGFMEEYRGCHVPSCAKVCRPFVKWCCPPSGRLKINVDGGFRKDVGIGGVGVVVRDENGTCKAALARTVQFAHSTYHVEAEALRVGLVLAVEQGWDEIVVESDCVMLVHVLTRDGDDLSSVGRVMEE